MKKRQLGTSGLEVSELGLGTWQTLSASTAGSFSGIARRAFERGVNFFDTADSYFDGESEAALGKILRQLPREEIVVATKVFHPVGKDLPDNGLRRGRIRKAVEHSLRRLGLETIDLYQCHRFDPQTPLADVACTMNELIAEGKVRHWGTSRWSGAQLAEAFAFCRSSSLRPPVSNQHVYNLLNRSFEKDASVEQPRPGVSLLAYSPLAQGVLTGKYSVAAEQGSRAANAGAARRMWDLTPEKIAAVEKWRAILRKKSLEPAAVALAWCLRLPLTGSVVFGASRPDQLETNLSAAGIAWSDTFLEGLTDALPA